MAAAAVENFRLSNGQVTLWELTMPKWFNGNPRGGLYLTPPCETGVIGGPDDLWFGWGGIRLVAAELSGSPLG